MPLEEKGSPGNMAGEMGVGKRQINAWKDNTPQESIIGEISFNPYS